MTRAALIAELTSELAEGDPTLTSEEIARVVDGSVRHTVWATGAAVEVGDKIVPTAFNGRVYEVTTAGTTGATEPGWPSLWSSAWVTVRDNGVTYRDAGVAYRSPYDRTRALRAGWLLKAKKVAHLVDISNGPDRVALSQRMNHFMEIANRYRPMGPV